jgi:hypothetical protein
MGRTYLIANAVLWAAAIVAAAVLGSATVLWLIVLPALAATSLLLARRKPGTGGRGPAGQ